MERTGPNQFSVNGAEDRTNNGMEAINSQLSNSIGSRPSFWDFFRKLTLQVNKCDRELLQLEAGSNIRRVRSNKLIFKNCQIQSFVNRLESGQISLDQFVNRVKNIIPRYINERLAVEPIITDDDNDINETAETTMNDSLNENDMPELTVVRSSESTNSSTDEQVRGQNMSESPLSDLNDPDLQENDSFEIEDVYNRDPIVSVLSGLATEEAPTISCGICLERPGERLILNCGHAGFHKECLINWINVNPTCPRCRSPVTSVNRIFVETNDDI